MAKKEKKLLRLTRAAKEGVSGRPRILLVDIERVDGVVIDSAFGRTQIVMLDGTTIYVREDPDEVFIGCESLGCPAGVFTKAGAKEAMRDSLE